jgi:hypothetical protein
MYWQFCFGLTTCCTAVSHFTTLLICTWGASCCTRDVISSFLHLLVGLNLTEQSSCFTSKEVQEHFLDYRDSPIWSTSRFSCRTFLLFFFFGACSARSDSSLSFPSSFAVGVSWSWSSRRNSSSFCEGGAVELVCCFASEGRSDVNMLWAYVGCMFCVLCFHLFCASGCMIWSYIDESSNQPRLRKWAVRTQRGLKIEKRRLNVHCRKSVCSRAWKQTLFSLTESFSLSFEQYTCHFLIGYEKCLFLNWKTYSCCIVTPLF